MSRADQFLDYGFKSIAVAGFIITYVRFMPPSISAVFDARDYVGYMISFQVGLLIVMVSSIFYLFLYINDLEENIENKIDDSFNYYLEDLEEGDLDREQNEEGSEEAEEMIPDGGRKIKSNSPDEESQISAISAEPWQKDSQNHSFGRLKTPGRGLIIGTIVGAPLGILFGQSTILVGGIIGAIIGNEIEYQSLREYRSTILIPESNDIDDRVSFDILSELTRNPHRRQVIDELSQDAGPISVKQLSESIAARKNNISVDNLSSEEYQKVFVALCRSHLPKLDNSDIIEYDTETLQVEAGDNLDTAISFLNHIRDSLELSQLNEDTVLELLRNRRRRQTLKVLSQREKSITLGELAEIIASEEHNTSINELSSKQRKSVYVALYQTHLPKLDNAGLVDYDQDQGIISKSNRFDEVFFNKNQKTLSNSVLRVVSFINETMYFGLLSLLSVIILFANLFEWWPISGIDPNILFSLYTLLIFTPLVYRLSRFS